MQRVSVTQRYQGDYWAESQRETHLPVFSHQRRLYLSAVVYVDRKDTDEVEPCLRMAQYVVGKLERSRSLSVARCLCGELDCAVIQRHISAVRHSF